MASLIKLKRQVRANMLTKGVRAVHSTQSFACNGFSKGKGLSIISKDNAETMWLHTDVDKHEHKAYLYH